MRKRGSLVFLAPLLVLLVIFLSVGCKGSSGAPNAPTPTPDPGPSPNPNPNPPPSLNCDASGEIPLNDHVFLVVKETVPPCGSNVKVGTVPRMVFEVTHRETSPWEEVGFAVVPLRDGRNSFPWPEWQYWSHYTRGRVFRGKTVVSQLVDTPWDPLITPAMVGPVEYLGIFTYRVGNGSWQDGPGGPGCKWDMKASPVILGPNSCNLGQNIVRVNWTIVP